jgi:hypothetical protein
MGSRRARASRQADVLAGPGAPRRADVLAGPDVPAPADVPGLTCLAIAGMPVARWCPVAPGPGQLRLACANTGYPGWSAGKLARPRVLNYKHNFKHQCLLLRTQQGLLRCISPQRLSSSCAPS